METLPNLIAGHWAKSRATDAVEVKNPANQDTLARTPLSTRAEVDEAAKAGVAAFESWQRVPVGERVQVLYKAKRLFEEHAEEIAKTITLECGKTLAEAKGELLRGIENVEVACGMPSLIQGYNSEDIAAGVDELMIRQPVGVVAVIAPFNFPAMIPLWFIPYAIACGNAVILKPSERVPLTMKLIFELMLKTGVPPGVLQLVNGSKVAVDAILQHPDIRAISFVGSSAVARYIYAEAAKYGKRVQCQGGAKNPVIVLPDADLEMSTKIIADSAFGCAGQRCLAASVAITVGSAQKPFTEAIALAAQSRKVGFGLDAGIDMGPVISQESKARVLGLIEKGKSEGATLTVDGRQGQVQGDGRGNFLAPTVLSGVDPKSELAQTEIFGPVLSLMHVADVDAAIALVNQSAYGNMACLFTTSGSAARKFRNEARVGNIGINLGVAAPMAYFPFSGWKGSFFGDLHAQGRDGVDFYTEKKVVVERWPKEWTRKF